MKHGLPLPTPRALILGNIILIALYAIMMPTNAPQWLALMVQSARAGMSFIVTAAYGWSIYVMSREEEGHRSHGLVIGIFLAFFADFYGSVMSILWRTLGRPDPWTTHAFWLFPSFLTSIAALHHIAVPGAIDGRIPKRSIILIAAALTLSVSVAAFVAGYQTRTMFPTLRIPFM